MNKSFLINFFSFKYLSTLHVRLTFINCSIFCASPFNKEKRRMNSLINLAFFLLLVIEMMIEIFLMQYQLAYHENQIH